MEMNVTGMQREPILLTRWTNIANNSILDQGYLQSSFCYLHASYVFYNDLCKE